MNKQFRHAPVAQLDRVFGYEPKGRGFESLLAYQEKPLLSNRTIEVFLYLSAKLQQTHVTAKIGASTCVFSGTAAEAQSLEAKEMSGDSQGAEK